MEKIQNNMFVCPSCGGKGHVWDSSSVLVFVIGWILPFFERNNPNGFTREECRQCSGKGYIEIKE